MGVGWSIGCADPWGTKGGRGGGAGMELEGIGGKAR